MDAKSFERFIEAFNANDMEAVLEFFTEDASYHSHAGPDALGKSFSGRAAIRTAFETRFKATPGGRFVLTEPAMLLADRGAAEWYFEFSSEAGQTRRLFGCDIFRFRGNKILSKNVYLKQHVPEGER